MEDTPSGVLKMEGRVASGLGNGARFLSLEWVRRELRQKLDLVPFPGTLNLRVPVEVHSALYVRRNDFLRIADPSLPNCPGFVTRVTLRCRGRSCRSAYLILPELTMYKDVMEIISAVNLREKLNLKDGDQVQVERFLER